MDLQIKAQIMQMVGINESADISQQGMDKFTRRNFLIKMKTYLQTAGVFSLHVFGLWMCRFISYKLISNREIMNFRR